MTDINEIKDTLNLEEKDMKKLPQMLNVLTILTYVGSAYLFLSGIYTYFTICKSINQLEDSMDAIDVDGFAGKMIESAMAVAEKSCDNRLLILIATIAACVLCAYGAMQMRNLKKQGFSIYVIGELLLPVVSIVLLGSASIGGMLMLTGLIVPIIFIILYFTQRKHLVN